MIVKIDDKTKKRGYTEGSRLKGESVERDIERERNKEREKARGRERERERVWWGWGGRVNRVGKLRQFC